MQAGHQAVVDALRGGEHTSPIGSRVLARIRSLQLEAVPVVDLVPDSCCAGPSIACVALRVRPQINDHLFLALKRSAGRPRAGCVRECGDDLDVLADLGRPPAVVAVLGDRLFEGPCRRCLALADGAVAQHAYAVVLPQAALGAQAHAKVSEERRGHHTFEQGVDRLAVRLLQLLEGAAAVRHVANGAAALRRDVWRHGAQLRRQAIVKRGDQSCQSHQWGESDHVLKAEYLDVAVLV
mmetsp:Transcript_20033/g.69536  ORF Transcript_20033/g.69536 Transcript_20033/m.69536 type:complete len:238 (+) Transcript_20033:699-1412(+)